MSSSSKNESIVDSLDSWEDLLENDSDGAFQKLNEALEKIQLSDTTVDPFSDSPNARHENSGSDESRFNGLWHLIALSGSPMNVDDVMYKLKKDFGNTVRLKQIDDSNALLVFSSVMDARHVARSQQKFAPLRLCSIDDPDFEHLDYVLENRHSLQPTATVVRPPTNMSMIRNTVSRHLNVNVPLSPQHREEKEQLRRARETKKAKDNMWK